MVTNLFLLEIIAGFSGLMFLAYASYYDLKKREVDDNVWKWMLITALGFNILRFFFYFDENWLTTWIIIIGSMLTGIILTCIILLFGLGGADFKAMILISLLSPLSPFVFEKTPSSGYLLNLLNKAIPFPMTIIMNAYIITLPLFLFFPLYNLINYLKRPDLYKDSYSLKQKALAVFTGYPASIHEIQKKPLWKYDIFEVKNERARTLEMKRWKIRRVGKSRFWNVWNGKVINEWRKISVKIPSFEQRRAYMGRIALNAVPSLFENHKWSLQYRLGFIDEIDEEKRRIDTLNAAIADGKNKLWIHATIPFLVPLTLGYLMALITGNIVLNFYLWLYSLII